ncbi:MAG: hypothetical protein OQK12_00160 [Motiliproteus sp.]|nr:hypothetical protein [Motiliproteus sp.]MCW9050818.1 hypothetical protein [Motiliproteus sp.]
MAEAIKLQLYFGSPIQGEVAIAHRNLMLVFQVNCPGCLIHGFPQLQQLAERFPDLNCFALSTAFEDFALNTERNTRLLVEQGELVQASKRYFQNLGQQKLPYSIELPVVMDRLLSAEQISELPTKVLGALEPDSLSPQIQQVVRNQIDRSLLALARSGRTFLNNQLQGTPSWLLFDEQLEIKSQWFGHREIEQIATEISSYL